MDLVQARTLLGRLPRFEVKPGLNRTLRLLHAAGNPEEGFPAIHVAGTNGKGSVVAMLDAVLRRAGYRVGRTTSPEVVDPRDRIVVDGEWISEVAFAAGVERLAPHLFPDEDGPTEFEALTALAFDHFHRSKVDVAVVEVGLGGRFDATNVVRPVLTILTTVGMDHAALLGDAIERIAWEKAGIAKEGVPLILGSLPADARGVVEREAAEAGAILVDGGSVAVCQESGDWTGSQIRVRHPGFPEEMGLALAGSYQLENLKIVLTAIEQLRALGWQIPAQAVVEGLRTVSWPGRFEMIRHDPPILLDGAHNVDGAIALAKEIAGRVPEKGHRHLLFGVFADKDVDGMIEALAPVFGGVTVCQSKSRRAMPAQALASRWNGRFGPVAWYDSVDRAIEAIVPTLETGDVLAVAGSLTVVAEAREKLLEEHEDAG